MCKGCGKPAGRTFWLKVVERFGAPKPDIVAMYKKEFFENYGQLLTAIVEDRIEIGVVKISMGAGLHYDDDFRILVDLTTAIVMDLRSRYHAGEDNGEGWLDALLKLIRVTNHASNVGLYNIAMRASSLVIDGAKIIKKMKTEHEAMGNRHVAIGQNTEGEHYGEER